LEAHYANIFAYRVSAQELVLEFGNFFQGQENRAQADFRDFSTRIVLSADLIEPVIKLLEEARSARDAARKAMSS